MLAPSSNGTYQSENFTAPLVPCTEPVMSIVPGAMMCGVACSNAPPALAMVNAVASVPVITSNLPAAAFA